MSPTDDRKMLLAHWPGRVVVMNDSDALIDKVAGELTVRAMDRVGHQGVFHLALSGGSTPRMLFCRLLIDPNFRGLPWTQTHLWQVDERCVGDDDERRNFRMIHEHLAAQVPTPPGQVHAMPVLDGGGDQSYEDNLRACVSHKDERGVPRLDYALLGMGSDGHTASLFPHTPALDEKRRLVVFNDGDQVIEPRPRMTMTYPLINAAKVIAVLVMGQAKREVLGRIAAAPDDAKQFPITGIKPTYDDTEVIWYFDEPAVPRRDA